MNNLKFISAIYFILANINKANNFICFFEPKIYSNVSSGSVEVICGSMFSGKTQELIRRLKRLKVAKKIYSFLNLRLILGIRKMKLYHTIKTV